MRKVFIPFLLVAVCILSCGCGSTHQQATATVMPASWQEDTVEATPLVYEEPEPEYDPSVDYMALMVQCAARGDTDALEAAVTARNAKIVGESLEAELLTVQKFIGNFEQYAGFSLDTDYTAEMISCCAAGDLDAGRLAAARRNMKIDAMGVDEQYVDFDDLYLVAKIITNEAGCCWLPMDWKMAVGEVLLNRVDSTEFPDTISECVYQAGQYSGSHSTRFSNLVPYEDCAEAAMRLMKGERVLNEPSVVFQSNHKQGSGVYLELYDARMGYTYICYSSHRELYE